MKRNEPVKRLWGSPKAKALRLPTVLWPEKWEYRGFRFNSRRNSGWAAGVTWYVISAPGKFKPQADSKHKLMVMIDHYLDNEPMQLVQVTNALHQLNELLFEMEVGATAELLVRSKEMRSTTINNLLTELAKDYELVRTTKKP